MNDLKTHGESFYPPETSLGLKTDFLNFFLFLRVILDLLDPHKKLSLDPNLDPDPKQSTGTIISVP